MVSPRSRSLFDGAIIGPAIRESFVKLDPRVQLRNPVMFIVEVGAFVSILYAFRDAAHGQAGFDVAISIWLWFTVLFANFAEAVAEGRGKAQAEFLRRTKSDTYARRINADGREEKIVSSQLRKGDRIVVEAGEIIAADGEIVEGAATVDESAITGESAPVIRESGGDRSSVTGGTRVLSDRIVFVVGTNPGESFLDRMISLVEGAKRQKTPNEIALSILLSGLTVIFIIAVATLGPFSLYAGAVPSVVVLIALLVCLIPTTIGGLLSAIGIAGMDRVLQRNVLAMSGRAVEAAGDVDTLLLDKTGTITLGNRQATEVVLAPGINAADAYRAAYYASLADETPEGRSIVTLCGPLAGIDPSTNGKLPDGATFVPFSAYTRMSGLDLSNGNAVRKGAPDAVRAWVSERSGGAATMALAGEVERIARAGGTPLLLADERRVLGVIYLRDILKPNMRERFDRLRAMGIRTVMITGDNPLTASAIAREAGVDDFLAEATPETKMALIKREQASGRLVAMTGDGTNDAPALAQADVGVAMNSGTQAAKEAGNMVDLDSDPTKLIEVVEVGKQLLMTRGALTTFSIANDVAKYFAILPAMFMTTYPAMGALNIMHLATPQSAILSAIIFNALIIIALIPLALRGVSYRPRGANAVLRENVLIYGLGGLVVPFVGIKIIDLILVALHLTGGHS
ncbi:MAG TPA: potassium-transporting ATPase subunit KdpB [Candidatus Limnocylindria bacterium]|jgi:K+-transporting ATPase ATPase B chain|nr:potassium-transporting ATPase subunit KdpB [Candidatus Limnocylindria bacterium]